MSINTDQVARSNVSHSTGCIQLADPVEFVDLTGDGMLNVLDVVALVEIILNP